MRGRLLPLVYRGRCRRWQSAIWLTIGVTFLHPWVDGDGAGCFFVILIIPTIHRACRHARRVQFDRLFGDDETRTPIDDAARGAGARCLQC